ncbi:MAG: cell division protein FtsZ [Bacteroidetes bacterium]|nr:cell division protein FtsZ [Bacteroidota bacterium]
MIHFDLPKEKSSILKVIGVGGGGGNAANYMFNQQVEGANFIICNTDAQALSESPIPNRIQLGPHLTQGLGAGANPDIGRQATEESLEEIKRILEVNTKMAFITAGMGGGTGTGGAPIIAKICKDLGILTVGIVTTPFSYEGKKRLQQAEEGIKNLQEHVDTLIVINNDKLRHQYGNLKMREAFERADNVLATAARCITDVISSTGQINVDFADVCTVMRNGRRAILGHAEVAGEDRALHAIEQALNSPLLNDNNIHGAKWLLINITSAPGQHEHTVDEVETIQQYLAQQAGDETDVIMGLGFDARLGDKLGVTVIASGIDHPASFIQPVAQANKAKEEKIVMVLGQSEEEVKPTPVSVAVLPEPVPSIIETPLPVVAELPVTPPEHLMPVLVSEEETPATEPVSEEPTVIHWQLEQEPVMEIPPSLQTVAPTDAVFMQAYAEPPATGSVHSGGYLSRPSNIYASQPPQTPSSPVDIPTPAVEPPQLETPEISLVREEDELLGLQMHLVERTVDQTPEPLPVLENKPAAPLATTPEWDEEIEQQRRAAERLQKLRSLSFNFNAADSNNEFETVPAYIRRNMELYNSSNTVENFYSNYEVRSDDKNQVQLSTINTFLDGKRPD